jgi:predicted ATPase
MMKPVVERVILKRFRSIPSETVEFANPTFFVGQNGSGKSNFVDAFSFLAEAMALPLQAVFDKRGGIAVVRNRTSGQSYPPNLGLGVVFGALNGDVISARYAFEIRALPNYGFHVIREQCLIEGAAGGRYWFEREKSKFRSNVAGLGPALDPSALALPLVGGEERFAPVLKTLASMRVYSIDPGKVGEMQDPDSGVSLRPDGSNAASVLQEIERRASKDEAQRICELLSTVVPNTTRVRPSKHGNKITLQFTQEWGNRKRLKFEAFNMSDGTLRALGLLMAVHQATTPSIVAIEEPEATIHPGALGAILDLLREAGQKMQVVVTTHSPELLDAKWIDDTRLRIVSWDEGATHVTSISEASREALRKHLMGAGELMRSNALTAAPLFVDVDNFREALFVELQ